MQRRVGLFLAAAILALLVIWAAWPGFLHVDAIIQLQEARSGRYGGWQPATGSWLWRQIGRFGPAPGGVLVAQCCLFFLALWRIAVRAHRSFLRFVLVAFLPLLFLGPLWKDSQMAVCLLAGVAFPLGSPLAWLAALAFRVDALLAIVPLLRPLRWFAVPGLVLALLFVAGLGRTLTPRMHFVSQQIFVQDLAAVSVAQGQSVFPEFFCAQPECMAALKAKYSVDSVTPILFDARHFRLAQTWRELAELLWAWSKSAPLHPWLLAQAHGHRFFRLLGVLQPPEGVVFLAHPLDGNAMPPLHAPAFWHWLGSHDRWMPGWPVALILVLYRRQKVAQSGLVYLTALFFIAPAVEFRYLAWPVMAAAATLLARR